MEKRQVLLASKTSITGICVSQPLGKQTNITYVWMKRLKMWHHVNTEQTALRRNEE
jgi:hypothetical protein